MCFNYLSPSYFEESLVASWTYKPYAQGLENIADSFASIDLKGRFTVETNFTDKVKKFFTGMLLLIPIINLIVLAILQAVDTIINWNYDKNKLQTEQLELEQQRQHQSNLEQHKHKFKVVTPQFLAVANAKIEKQDAAAKNVRYPKNLDVTIPSHIRRKISADGASKPKIANSENATSTVNHFNQVVKAPEWAKPFALLSAIAQSKLAQLAPQGTPSRKRTTTAVNFTKTDRILPKIDYSATTEPTTIPQDMLKTMKLARSLMQAPLHTSGGGPKSAPIDFTAHYQQSKKYNETLAVEKAKKDKEEAEINQRKQIATVRNLAAARAQENVMAPRMGQALSIAAQASMKPAMASLSAANAKHAANVKQMMATDPLKALNSAVANAPKPGFFDSLQMAAVNFALHMATPDVPKPIAQASASATAAAKEADSKSSNDYPMREISPKENAELIEKHRIQGLIDEDLRRQEMAAFYARLDASIKASKS